MEMAILEYPESNKMETPDLYMPTMGEIGLEKTEVHQVDCSNDKKTLKLKEPTDDCEMPAYKGKDCHCGAFLKWKAPDFDRTDPDSWNNNSCVIRNIEVFTRKEAAG